MYVIETETCEWIELTKSEASATWSYLQRQRGNGTVVVRRGPRAFDVRSSELGTRYAIPYESTYGVELTHLLEA
jgi:hypothetical protein